jgi:hypothetical protein
VNTAPNQDPGFLPRLRAPTARGVGLLREILPRDALAGARE